MKKDSRMDIVERRSYQVVKANQIIQQARYDLTLKELKLLGYLISQVKPNDAPGKFYALSIKEYCAVRGIDSSGKNYDAVKKGLKALRDKSFWLQREDGSEVTVGWLGKAEINRGSGKIRVQFDSDLQKYITVLQGNYTQYELLATLPMKSAYSIRLYELLKSYSFNHKEVTITIDELKEKAGCGGLYSEYRDLRRKVIEVAIKEINLYTDLEVSYEKICTGKTVTKLVFYLDKKDIDGRLLSYANAEKELDAIPGQMTLFDYDVQNRS